MALAFFNANALKWSNTKETLILTPNMLKEKKEYKTNVNLETKIIIIIIIIIIIMNQTKNNIKKLIMHI